MKINRRQFIKLSSLTSFGLWTGFSSFAQFFNFIPPAEQDFIPVAGIFPNPGSIKENGIHLRWVLPPSKGIPTSLIIYRRNGSQKENNILIRPTDSNKKTLPEQIDQITFSGPINTFFQFETNFGKCYEVKPINSNGLLRITFSSGVDFCNVQLGIINPLVAKSYHQDGTLSQSIEIEMAVTYKTISFHSTNGRSIKYVEIPTNFKFLYFIEFNGNQYLCDSPGWEKIGFIDNENDINNKLLFKRINPETKNFYLTDDSDLLKYETIAEKYAGLMGAILNPSSQYFLVEGNENINDIPPDKLILKTTNESSSKINAWNLLMFGSLDTNNARMLGLYFVDSSVKSENEIYDYKVEANYIIQSKETIICGVVQSVGGKYSDLPVLKDPLIAIQTNKTWWEFDKDFNESHLGKVRLSWSVPEQNTGNESWKRFVQPVVYALQVDSNKSRLISPQLDENSLYFIDQRVIVKKEEINYNLVGIDIFGQTSNPLKEKIKLIDKDVPPPPVKLQFNSSGNQVFLQYEYGGYQYLTDPQTDRFTIFRKLESIYSGNKKTKYNSFEELGNTESGSRIIKINLAENIGSTSFENIHFIENFNGNRLPAVKRKKFRISDTTSNSVTFNSSHSFIPEVKGTVLLEADIRDKNGGWAENGSVNFIKPVLNSRLIDYNHFIENSNDISHFSGDNLNNQNSLNALVLSSNLKRRSENKNLFETNPFEPGLDEYTEIFIDRTLIESDIFTGGKISIGNINHDIIAQSAGSAVGNDQSLQIKIIINAHLDIDSGTPVLISLPKINSNDVEKYIHNCMIFRVQTNNNLKSKTSGEILIRGTKNYNLDGKKFTEIIPIIAQVLSDLYPVNNSSELEILVKITKKISSLPTSQNLTAETSNKILYFEPYITNITNSIDSISLSKNEAFKTSQFAVDSIDSEGNKSPLSLFAQFIKTRSIDEKPLKPERPFPCGNPSSVEAFLKLPNSEGRSFFCLQWNDIKDSSGISMQYRYEVGRALDKSIIAVHKDLWLKGLVDSILQIAERTTDTNGNLPVTNSIVLPESGLIEVTANYGLAVNISPENFLGGRLTQGTDNNRKYYEVVKIFRENLNLKLTLREMIKTTLGDNFTDYSSLPSGNNSAVTNPVSPVSNSNFILEAVPDYKLVLADSNKLIDLADLTRTTGFPNIPDGLGAFSLVTGQPLRNTNQFLDDVPGLGNSRFFYKIRSVDASENRSEWSLTSVPVWQLDTSPPEAPTITYIEGQEQSAYIKWKNEKEIKIAGYLIYRTDKKVNNGFPNEYETEKLIKTFMKQNIQNDEVLPDFVKIRHRFNQIELPVINELNDNSNRITGVFKFNSLNEPDTSINCLIINPTLLDGQNIINLHPSIREAVRVVVVLNSSANTEIVVYKGINANLISAGGQITLPSIQDINPQVPLLGIFKLQDYKFGESVENQSSENYFIESSSQYIPEKSLLKGFYSLLKESERVAVQITKSDGIIIYVTEDTAEYEYTDDLKNSLNLDLFYNYRMEAIKTLSITNPPTRIMSLKSTDASVQIKMNTPPSIPEILNAEWWDLSSNTSANSASVNVGVRVIVKLMEQNGFCILKKQNPSNGFFETKQTNLNQFILQTDGTFILTIVDPGTEIHSDCVYQVEFINYWEGKSRINFELKGL